MKIFKIVCIISFWVDCYCSYLQLGNMDESLFMVDLDFIPFVHAWKPCGYSLTVPGSPFITKLRFVGIVKKRKPTPDEMKHENFTARRQTMIPVSGPFYRLKNGSWYYENPNLKLYRGDILNIYLRGKFSNLTRRTDYLRQFVIPIGKPPKIDTIERIEDNHEDYYKSVRVFNYL